MKTNNSENGGSRAFSISVLALLAIVVAWLSRTVVWLGDDVDYAFIIHDNVWTSSGHINSLSDLLQSQAVHWTNANGRAVAHTLVQLFCGVLGQGAFVVCNALVYCLFVWLVVRMAGVRKPLSNPMAIATAAVLTPLCFLTKMMPSCQIGFVWMFCLSLLWLHLFVSRPRCGWLATAGIALLGLLAGNGQEALSIGLSGALAIWMIRRRGAVGLRRGLWIVFYWLGTASSCFSPGTLGRAGRLQIDFSDSLIYLVFASRALYLLIAVMLWLRLRHGMGWRRQWRRAALYLNAALILLVFNLYIGVYSNRQLFGLELMAVIAILRLLPGHAFKRLWLAVFAVLALWLCIHQQRCAARVTQQYRDIVESYLGAPDGTVLYDRTLGSLNPFDREFRIYEDITGYGAHETRRTLIKDVSDRYPGRYPLRLYPMAITRLSAPVDTVVEYAPGHYMVLVTENRPDKFRIESHNTILPWIKYTDETVADGYPAVGGPGWYATLVAPWRPFAEIDSIYVKR